MQWIDWEYMRGQKDPIFDEVIEVCEHHGLTRIMALQHDWCDELIAQFYATVLFDKDIANTIHWMSRGVRYKATYHQFSQILGFTLEDLSNKKSIYDDKAINANQILYMYDESGRHSGRDNRLATTVHLSQ